ncbi:MAG TPA: glycoside hydrolase family 16 protein [Marmoricola sp.]|nr:glycoside hydrolase family 16 protein [Marmoricola sp.]
MRLVLLAVLVGSLVLATACASERRTTVRAAAPSQMPTPTISTNPDPEQVTPDRPCGPELFRPNGKSWRCTFADNFDGDGLDDENWLVLASAWTGLGGPDDCYFNDDHNISVANGQLRLTTRRLTKPRACAQAAGGRASYSGAMINTIHRFSQERGRFEFRARFPVTTVAGEPRPGVQGSLWMWPIDDDRYGPWPSSGEIDIAEFYSAFPDRVIPFLHYDMETDAARLAGLTTTPMETNNECRFAAPDGDFHTYTLVWSKSQMHIKYDGATCLKTPWLAKQGGRAPFDQPFMLAIGFGAGKYDNSVTDQTPMPVHLDVDYVRVWK